MSYTKKFWYSMNTADDLSSAADHAEILRLPVRCVLYAVRAFVTTVLSGAATIQFDITPGSTATRDTAGAGTITIPTTTAVGQVVNDQLAAPVIIEAGDFVTPQVSSAATSGGCTYHFLLSYEEESVGNATNVTESA